MEMTSWYGFNKTSHSNYLKNINMPWNKINKQLLIFTNKFCMCVHAGVIFTIMCWPVLCSACSIYLHTLKISVGAKQQYHSELIEPTGASRPSIWMNLWIMWEVAVIRGKMSSWPCLSRWSSVLFFVYNFTLCVVVL